MEVKNNLLKRILDKKVRYAFYSLGISLCLIVAINYVTSDAILKNTVIAMVALAIVATLVAQFLISVRSIPFVYAGILLAHLAVGFVTTFYFFPNLGVLVRYAAFFGLFLAVYILYLITNIFFVIEEKGSLIPLYTVAVTWAQIMIIAISIPYFSGVYKIPTNYVAQNSLIFISSFLFTFYMVWCMTLDPFIKKTKIYEKLFVSFMLSTLISILGVGVSFFPTESFLRAVFIASGLLFGLSYIQAHYKNRVTKKLILEHLIISTVFFIILIVFKP